MPEPYRHTVGGSVAPCTFPKRDRRHATVLDGEKPGPATRFTYV